MARTAAGAKTLPREYYVSEDLFAQEREKIFSRHWLYVGHVGQIPEPADFFVTRTFEDSGLVLRDFDLRVRAHHNVCRHRGSRLCSEEAGRLPGAIQCPYHAWTYELDGRLRSAPTMEGVDGFDRADYPLHPLSCRAIDGLLFVKWGREAMSFERQLGALVGRFERWNLTELTPVHRTAYEVEANWKLLFQNYSECYHCPTAHPLLNRLTPFRDSTNDLESGAVLGGPMTMAGGRGSSMTLDGRACAAPLGTIAGEDLDKVYYYTVFPNLFISAHPDYVLLHRSQPLAVDRTRVVCDWLFDPAAVETAGFDPRGAIEFWDATNREDWRLCALAQAGIASSAYTPGPYAELESQLAAFDRHYLEVLNGE